MAENKPENTENEDLENESQKSGGRFAALSSLKEKALPLLKNKIVLFGALPVLVLMILTIGAGAYLGWFSATQKAEEQAQEAAKAVSRNTVVFMELPGMTIDLKDQEQRQKFLRVRLVLEVPNADVADAIRPIMPKVTDVFQVYLRELRPSDVEGSAGIYRLKEELTRRVNIAIHPQKINAVLFEELLIQ